MGIIYGFLASSGDISYFTVDVIFKMTSVELRIITAHVQ